MKILSLTINNLASIEGTHEIDFTTGPLASAGIYAISGATGAGKSTILDALCLALYDCTPRFAVQSENLYVQDVGDNQIDQNDVRNILRRGMGEGFAEVLFEGIDGSKYKSRWSVHRTGYNPLGPILPQTIQLYNVTAGEEYYGTKEELLGRLARLTGLNYEQFTRTVLLAQNDFATFLKSRESQKAELLEKLTGTEIYSQISRAIYVRNKSIHSEMTFLKQSLKQIEIISDEDLEKMARERAESLPQREYANKQLMLMVEQLRILTIYKQQYELLEQKSREHDDLKKIFDSLLVKKEKEQEEYKSFRQETESLKPELDRAAELDNRIINAEEKYKAQHEVCLTASQRCNDLARAVANKEQILASELKWMDEQQADSNVNQLDRLQNKVEQQKLLLDKLRLENDERMEQLNEYGLGKLVEEQNALVKDQQQLIENLKAEVAQMISSQESEQSIKDIEDKLQNFKLKQKELIADLNNYQALFDEWQSAEGEINIQRGIHDTLKDSLSFYQLLWKDVNSGKEQLESMSEIRKEEDTRLATLQKELEQLRRDRRALLNGKVIQEVQSSLQNRQNEFLQQIEIIHKEVDRCNSSILVLDGEIRQLTITVKALEFEKQAIQNAEKLPIMIEKQKTLITEMDRRNAYIENIQSRQHENRAKYSKIKAEIEKKQESAEKWDKLNWLIGSSDGAKFKIIAQSYTLNLLLLHANKHLGYLSKRYRLQQVPDTLSLQVIDNEMCNEIRTIYSLSGGESFIISLALALGLSSLSSNNLKVDSLFIDEGFGSLDSESLHIAMQALEQLYYQGKKIGIISHIQEMTERIPVRIHVERTINGKSRIEIIS